LRSLGETDRSNNGDILLVLREEEIEVRQTEEAGERDRESERETEAEREEDRERQSEREADQA
jgi:hypothetical protein